MLGWGTTIPDNTHMFNLPLSSYNFMKIGKMGWSDNLKLFLFNPKSFYPKQFRLKNPEQFGRVDLGVWF